MTNRTRPWLLLGLMISFFTIGCADATSQAKVRPVADAGSDIKAPMGTQIQLDGQRSFSPSGDDLVFQWEILSLSDGMADLRDDQTPLPTLTIYQESACLMQLVVADAHRESLPDIIQILAVDERAALDTPAGNPPPGPAGCEDGATCDDGNPCSSHDTCQNGICVAGATDRDQDGDGFLDPACPGGNDCDDRDPAVHPGAAEGGYAQASCRDGVDNNCDGKVDYLDPGCKPDPNQFNCKKRITIDHTKVVGTTTLSGFPLYFTLVDNKLKTSDPSTCMKSASANGIAFVNLAGEPLPHEIETYDPATGTLVAWVRIGALSPSTDVQIYMLFGGPAQAQSSELPTQVWGTSYRGVWHLEEPQGDGQHADSTANHNNATPSGNTQDKGFNDVGFGQKLDGGNKQIAVPHSPSLDLGSRFAVSMWVKWNDPNPPQDYRKLISQKEVWNAATGFALATKHNDDNTLIVNASGVTSFEVSGCIADGWKAKAWHHIGVSFQNTTAIVICDGVAAPAATLPSGIQNNTRPLTIGKLETEAISFKGMIDEVQIFSVSSPVEWIQTQHKNQSDPATFYTVVDE